MVRSSHKTSTGDLLVRLVGLRCPHVAHLSLRDHSDEVKQAFIQLESTDLAKACLFSKIYDFVCGQTRRWPELQRDLASG